MTRYDHVIFRQPRVSAMDIPISIRLDDDTRHELEQQARSRRARIRDASSRVAGHVAQSAEGRAFYEDWGTPNSETR